MLALLAAAAATAATACSDATGPKAETLEVVEFSTWATVATSIPLTIEARDLSGLPVAGAPVRAVPLAKGSKVEPAEGVTGADGRWFVLWTLSPEAGDQSLLLETGTTELTLVATARAGPPEALIVVGDPARQGAVGEPLDGSVVLESRDRHGNASGGAAIEIAVTDGGGSVDPARGVTGADGRLSVDWTLGPALGSQQIEVRMPGAEPKHVTADAVPGPTAALERVSGDGQTGTVGATLPEPLAVRARDRFGNPSRTPVTFSVHGDGGTVSVETVVPDSDGLATTGWMLGTVAGTARVAAHTPDGTVVQFSATVLPGPPEALVEAAGDGQLGYTSGTLAQPLAARVVDAHGNGVSGLPVAFSVVEGGGIVTPEAATTDDDGLILAEFTLGPAIGVHRVAATITADGAGGGSGHLVFEARAASLPPARMRVVAGDGQDARVGSAVTSAPSVLVSDAVGNPVPGVAVDFSPASGSGSVTGSTPTTDAAGVAAVGAWVLGTAVGPQRLTAVVVGAAPVAISANALPGPPVAMRASAGDGQSAVAGSPLVTAPEIRVEDAFGNGVPGVDVAFAVTGGGGTVDLTAMVTGASGLVSPGRWTLGSSPGTNTLLASATGLSPVSFHASGTTGSPDFSIEIRFVGNVPSSQQSAVLSAAGRWSSIVSGDLPSASVDLAAGTCGNPHPGFNGVVDDVVVFVQITTIDGPGGTIGSAGPCWLRSGSLLPIFGAITLDSDDVATLEANGRLYDVAVHELGHVLGIGTLWQAKTLLQDAGGTDPHFTGTSATQEYLAGGGGHDNPVPVENAGGSGTRDAHWRESHFGTEVMTGWINFGAPNLLSRVSIGSLADLGYAVRIGAADQFAALAPPTIPPAPPLRLSETPLGVPVVVR